MTSQLDIKNVRYKPPMGNRRILSIENIQVPSPRLIALIGANGAGKSTLLRGISGAIDIEGEVFLDGNAIHPRRDVFAIYQNPNSNIFLDLTVRENIALVDSEFDSFIDEVKTALEAVYERNALARFLSGGEKQLLGLSLAAQMKPRLLVLDEFTASLDQKNKSYCCRVVQELFSDITVLWATQELRLARQYADIFAIMEQGSIRQDDVAPVNTIDVDDLLRRLFT